MACCIFIFLWVQDELSFDRFHKNGDNIYRVIVEYPGGISSNSPLDVAPYMIRNYPEVTKITRLRIRQHPLKYADTNSYEIGLMVDADFFRIFSFPFIKGNPQKAFPDDKSIVISQKIAYKFFGNKDPLGKILRYLNNYDLTVTGIIENVDSNSHLRFDFVVPIQIIGEQMLRTWAWDNTTYLLLRENTNLDGFRKKIAGIIMKEDKRSTTKTRVDIQPLTRIHLYSLSGGSPSVYVYLFSAIALIVLLIACINFTNLSTAMSSCRSKEIGLRKVFGKMFSIWRREGKIIGVIKDFHSTPFHNKIIPVVFNMERSTSYYRILFVKVKPGTIKNTLNYLKNVIKELAPDFPFRYQFLDDVFDKQYISEKQTGTIFKYFTFLALFISCMGLYSLVSYMAEQKTKEIGIRKVFGASVQQIIYLLTKEFVKLVMISSLVAFPIAYYVMSKWLQNYAYHTNINIRIFIISGVISVIIAFFTVFYRSFRAASANLIDSLKYE